MADEEKNAVEQPTEEQKPQTKPKETSGEYLWRVFKPAGCILILLFFIAYLVICFTLKTPA